MRPTTDAPFEMREHGWYRFAFRWPGREWVHVDATKERCAVVWGGSDPARWTPENNMVDSATRCILNAWHKGSHEWPEGTRRRYAMGEDVVLVPDARVDVWKASGRSG